MQQNLPQSFFRYIFHTARQRVWGKKVGTSGAAVYRFAAREPKISGHFNFKASATGVKPTASPSCGRLYLQLLLSSDGQF